MFDYNRQIAADPVGKWSISYWQLYTEMFQYFAENLHEFADNMPYVEDILQWAINKVDLATQVSQSEHTDFFRTAKNAIAAATVAIRTNGRVIL